MTRMPWVAAAAATITVLVALRLSGPATAAETVPSPTTVTGRTVEQAARVTRTYETAHFRIDYVNDFVNEPEHSITDEQAILLALDLEAARFVYVDLWGFLPPPTPYLPGKTWVTVNSDGGNRAGGVSKGGLIELLPITQVVRASLAQPPTGTPQHELFHEVQRAYVPPIPGENWVFEGTAALAEDHVHPVFDDDPASSYLHHIEIFLDNPDMQYVDDFGVLQSGLTGHWYGAALFWKYFSERYGTSPTTEPGFRFNAIKAYYEARRYAPVMAAIEAAVFSFGSLVSFEEIFRDFTIANYTKDLTYTAKYAYWDDNTTPYPPAYRRVHVVSPTGAIVSYPSESLGPWSARYYEMVAGPGCLYLQVEATPTNGSDPFFHLISRKDTSVLDVQTLLGVAANRTYYANAGGHVTSVGIAAGSEATPVSYTLTSRCLTPTLSVLAPNAGNVAYGGDPASPDNILIELQVLADGQPVTGLDSSAFTVTIGGKPASIVSSASVQDQYWLVVQAPTQPASTTYSLTVGLNGLSPLTVNNAVRYLPRPTADQILVIDNSGSMLDEDKLGAARNAAQLFIDVAAPDDFLGVVTFSTASRLALPLVPANPVGKLLAVLATAVMTANGNTCIGCGADTAQTELTTHGGTGHFRNIVLLSDGMENVAPYWNDVRGAITPTETVIDTVFLGPADAAAEFLMQRIAKETGGTYTRVFLDSEDITTSSLNSRSAASLDLSLANRLANVYKANREGIERHERFFEKRGLYPRAGATETVTVTMAMRELVIAVNWDRGDLNPTLRRPDGTLVTSSDPDVVEIASSSTNRAYRLTNPAAGAWVLTFNPVGDMEYLVVASGKTGTNLFPIVGLPYEKRIVGADVPLLAALADTQPITGATVRVTVQGPDPRQSITLRLRDDGQHGDGKARDGVYGAVYPLTRLAGSYRFEFEASGVNHAGEPFTLYEERTIFMLGGPDHDGDGMSTFWEIRWGFNPFGNDDGVLDSDDDGLSNFLEFQLGTNPRDSDTDGGGESDGSEVRRRNNPFDESDDGVRPPRWLVPRPGNNHVVVTYELPPGAVGATLYRTPVSGIAAASATASSVVTFSVGPSGTFTDTTARNGVTYRYYLEALGADGARSRPSAALNAKPSSTLGPPLPDSRRYLPIATLRAP
ncbi:MAG: hypothetical protein KatS3mg060_0502 [Dehalococcoidia bacterium]|nr:MAG: hypothetical protein KatS3mg060_0502 [Dehalococcoidia bacterium]